MNTLIDEVYIDINRKFKAVKDRFFPLKVSWVNREVFIILAEGWIERMTEDELDWLTDYLDSFRAKYKVPIAFTTNSPEVVEDYVRRNKDYPKSAIDIQNFPPNPYPNNSNYFATIAV